jgi:hypothetical protein
MSMPPPIPVKRSTFVTVVGWIFIGLSGFMTLIGILQNIMLQLVFLPSIHQELAAQPLPPGMPPQMLWMVGNFHWLFRLFLLLALIHLVGAIGLLLRKHWGRLLFIGALVFDCVYQLAAIAFQWWFMGTMMHAPAFVGSQPADVAALMDGVMTVMRVFSLIIAAGFLGLFGWIITRLRSEPIRREFMPPSTLN